MLIESVSGMRGVIGKDLRPDIIIDRALRFAKYTNGKKFLLARDTRKSGEAISQLVKGALCFYGFDVFDAGIIPTPTALLYIREHDLDGGFIITASHNPKDYNGIKFVLRDGSFPLNWNKNEYPIFSGDMGDVHKVEDAVDYHIKKVLKNNEKTGKKLRICVDTNNGAAYSALFRLLTAMGHDVVALNNAPSGIFVHNPEPKKKHLLELDLLLKQKACDLGFGTDPDADRLITGISEVGILSEEYTLPLAIIGYGSGDYVVVNYSTSMLSDYAARKIGAKIVKTKVGEANVVSKMKEINAHLGGEGNGGVIFSHINSARDSLVGAFYITKLAEKGILKDIVLSFPVYYLVKEKIKLTEQIDIFRLKSALNADFISEEDGLYFEWPDAWLHVRKSNTEPIIRIYAESTAEERAKDLIKRAVSLLS